MRLKIKGTRSSVIINNMRSIKLAEAATRASRFSEVMESSAQFQIELANNPLVAEDNDVCVY